jgi:hypothetical protein
MSTLDEIAKEKQRVGEALALIDAQREKLASELSELETTARVLARYDKGPRAKRATPPATPATEVLAPPSYRRGRPAAGRSADAHRTSLTLGDRVLALATGKTKQEITAACEGVRPNHIGVVIARHKRAGRIEERDGKLYAKQSAPPTQAARS